MRRTASEILSDLEIRIARLERTASAKVEVIHTEYPLGVGERPEYTKSFLTHRQIASMVFEGRFDKVTVEDDEIMFAHKSFFAGGVGNVRVITNDGLSLALYVQKSLERKGKTLEITDWRD
jgi:hypothetical protein